MRFLCHLTGNPSDAEDLLQDTFLTLWRKRDQFEGRGSPAAYLRKIAFRQFLNAVEKRDRRASLAPPAEEGLAEPAERALEENDSLGFLILRVRAAVRALPTGPREAFILFRFENLSCAEIAELTGAPVKTVETRLMRATQLLASRLRHLRDHLPTT